QCRGIALAGDLSAQHLGEDGGGVLAAGRVQHPHGQRTGTHLAFNWPGVPSAITVPLSITARRSASWSASSRYWVVSRMVVPASTRVRMISQTWLRLRGSIPVVGSSRNIRSGVTIREPAMSRRRRIPPEYFFTGRPAA